MLQPGTVALHEPHLVLIHVGRLHGLRPLPRGRHDQGIEDVRGNQEVENVLLFEDGLYGLTRGLLQGEHRWIDHPQLDEVTRINRPHHHGFGVSGSAGPEIRHLLIGEPNILAHELLVLPSTAVHVPTVV